MIEFHVVKELAEQVLVSNFDSQKLGLIKIRETDQLEPMVSDCPGSFTKMINNLSVLLPNIEDGEDTRHACSNVPRS